MVGIMQLQKAARLPAGDKFRKSLPEAGLNCTQKVGHKIEGV